MICNTFINKLRTKYINHINISNYIIERLLYKNINKAFGYNGGAALPLFDAISKSNKFEMIFNRHEQSSGHCAEAYSKITNNIGTVITTSGPGFTNVITPLQDAYSDSIPLLCISCQVSSKVLGTHAFQESNTIGISKACVKWNYLMKKQRTKLLIILKNLKQIMLMNMKLDLERWSLKSFNLIYPLFFTN